MVRGLRLRLDPTYVCHTLKTTLETTLGETDRLWIAVTVYFERRRLCPHFAFGVWESPDRLLWAPAAGRTGPGQRRRRRPPRAGRRGGRRSSFSGPHQRLDAAVRGVAEERRACRLH